jgi:hypothetical protein
VLSKCDDIWNAADETTQTGVDTINTIDEITDFIESLPTADVQPIKKGHWYHNTSKYISELDAYFIQACCSCCGKYSDRVDSYSTIMSNETCSHCGARMSFKDGDT